MPELSSVCTVGVHVAGRVATVGHPRQGLTALVLRQGGVPQLALKGESGVRFSSSYDTSSYSHTLQDLYFAGEVVDYLRPNAAGIELPSLGRLIRTGLSARVHPENVSVLGVCMRQGFYLLKCSPSC